jgi:hypothetical protein
VQSIINRPLGGLLQDCYVYQAVRKIQPLVAKIIEKPLPYG